MAWAKLIGETATITVRSTGKIEWNDEAHHVLLTPKAVELFHEAGENLLGFRRVALRGGLGLSVAYNQDDHFYHIDADVELDELKPDEDFEATPQGPSTGTPGGGEEVGIFWVELP